MLKARGNGRPSGDGSHELLKRVLFTLMVMGIYFAGRLVPIPGLDASQRFDKTAGNILEAVMNGSGSEGTLMALGILPYINASILIQFATALLKGDTRTRISRQRIDRWTGILVLFFAFGYAILRVYGLPFRKEYDGILAIRVFAVLEMAAGTLLIWYLIRRNREHGLGESTPIILFNLSQTLVLTAVSGGFFSYPLLPILCIAAAGITALMELLELRIPVQRVSIHNLHADRNYIPYKMNPVGVMPAMFASGVFVFLQFALRTVAAAFPENTVLSEMAGSLDLEKPAGAGVYVFIILILAVSMSYLMQNPSELSKQLERNGDSIPGIYPGKRTVRYLRLRLTVLSIFSGLVQAGIMGASLWMALEGLLPRDLAMLPASVMMLTSTAITLGQEILMYLRMDRYRFFL